jgi:penicillin amidase
MRSLTRWLPFLIPLVAGCSSAPETAISQVDQVHNPALSSTVDVIRDQWGIPHIYGDNLPDVAFAEGYLMAEDRLVQMDLVRHNAAGKLTELGGDLSPSLFDGDVAMRTHHLESTAIASWQALSASADPNDQLLASTLTKFSAGVNAYLADLSSGKFSLPPVLQFAYDPSNIAPWQESDSILIGMQIAYELSFDAGSDIARTNLEAAAATAFDNSGDPDRQKRRGIGRDFDNLAPMDPTFTLPGDFSNLGPIALAQPVAPASMLALLSADLPLLDGQGKDWRHSGARGSNNWIIGPQLSATGHTIVANDPHLGLQNPANFYLVELVVRGGPHPVRLMGAQFPGAPGVILGHNEHVAWAATTSNLDVTDVYQETIVPCDGSSNPCVVFNGQKVALVPRQEDFQIGRMGNIKSTRTITIWDVPQHGPIISRVTADHMGVEPLGTTELSVRWTGHQPQRILSAVMGMDLSSSVKEAAQALQRDFRVGGQNWLLGDDQGHFGWTEATQVPRRPAGTVPWKVMPGDGSAEWGDDLDLMWVPHAFDPDAGFLATANADPVGVTADGDPFASEPVVDGIPLYIGADFDPGTRVGRITKRLTDFISQGHKITVEDMQSIQADDVSEWDQQLAPTLLDASQALAQEIATPGSHPELSAMAMTADMPSKALVQQVHDLVASWDFTTHADSQAAVLFNVWVTRFIDLALSDEIEAGNLSVGDDAILKLLVRACNDPTHLNVPLSSTGDSILFDDLNTPGVIESKRQMAAKGVLDMLDYLLAGQVLGPDFSTWNWGRIHTLTLGGLLPLDALQIPLKGDAMYPNGFPRHGDNGTVDVGEHGTAVDSFGYSSGPNIRAVYDMDPAGPHVKNTLPGGEIWDPNSPHYRDQLDLWVQNQTFDYAFSDADAVASAKIEVMKNGGGRVRFSP